MCNAFKNYDFFICFAECNVEEADKIVEFCERKENGGFKCYHIDRDSPSGTFSEVLRLALDDSKMIMMLLSNKALSQRWFDVLMNESLMLYVDDDMPIIAVFIDEIHEDNLPEILNSFSKLKYDCKFFWFKLKERLKKSKAAFV